MRMRNIFWLLLAVLLIAPCVKAADNGLVLWLNYNQNVQDQSGSGNNGTLEDPWSSGLPTYAPSLPGHGSAMVFGYGTWQGMSWNNVTVAKSDSLAHIGTKFSMGGWIRVDSTSNYQGYYEYPKMISSPNYELTMQSSSDSASYFWPYAQDANPWGTAGSWDMTMAETGSLQGNWMHMIVTYDGATFKQYLNGSLAFTATNFAHQFNDTVWDDPEAYWTNADLKIGAMLGGGYPASGGWLTGALDDTAIWGNAYLDAAGVAALYNGTKNPLTVTTIPEPATMLLLGLGFTLLRRKNS
jgi:hypothetical protein